MKGHSGTIVQEIGFRSCSPTFSFESSCAFEDVPRWFWTGSLQITSIAMKPSSSTDSPSLISAFFNPFKWMRNERMSKSEGSGGKLVGYARLECVQIVAGVPSGHGPESKLGHVWGTQNDWQPFFVDDVLVLSYDYPPRLLENRLIIPFRVFSTEEFRYAVVFSHPKSVHHN